MYAPIKNVFYLKIIFLLILLKFYVLLLILFLDYWNKTEIIGSNLHLSITILRDIKFNLKIENRNLNKIECYLEKTPIKAHNVVFKIFFYTQNSSQRLEFAIPNAQVIVNLDPIVQHCPYKQTTCRQLNIPLIMTTLFS